MSLTNKLLLYYISKLMYISHLKDKNVTEKEAIDVLNYIHIFLIYFFQIKILYNKNYFKIKELIYKESLLILNLKK